MKQWIIWLILFLSIIAEGTITTLPLVLSSFLILMVFLRKNILFWIALIVGLILDLMLVRDLGLTSVIFLFFLIIISLYENKFETSTSAFILISSFLGSLIYLLFFGIQNAFIQSIFCSFLTLLIFKLLLISEIKTKKYKFE